MELDASVMSGFGADVFQSRLSRSGSSNNMFDNSVVVVPAAAAATAEPEDTAPVSDLSSSGSSSSEHSASAGDESEDDTRIDADRPQQAARPRLRPRLVLPPPVAPLQHARLRRRGPPPVDTPPFPRPSTPPRAEAASAPMTAAALPAPAARAPAFPAPAARAPALPAPAARPPSPPADVSLFLEQRRQIEAELATAQRDLALLRQMRDDVAANPAFDQSDAHHLEECVNRLEARLAERQSALEMHCDKRECCESMERKINQRMALLKKYESRLDFGKYANVANFFIDRQMRLRKMYSTLLDA